MEVVLEQADGIVAGVEVKGSARVTASGFVALQALRDQLGKQFRASIVLYLGDRVIPFGEKLWLVPVQACGRPNRHNWYPRLNLGHRLLRALEQLLHFFDINLRRRIMFMPHHFLHPRRIRIIEQRKRGGRVPQTMHHNPRLLHAR